jgi:PhzF family phenazine biosynthesis protein
MPIPIAIVDAFTDRPFAGNPAAVCPLDDPAPAEWMQRVAIEMNLSETVFLTPGGDADADFNIRWFTPGREVNLCGHATLAAAHYLYESARADDARPIHFSSRSGPLSARRDAEGRIALDFPSKPATNAELPKPLVPSLAAAAEFLAEAEKLMAVFPSEAHVRDFTPDLAAIEATGAEGLIITAPADDDETHFVSRFFAPAVGVPEDPVCGSAHCVLTPYWAARLGQHRMTARQLSSRGGTIHVELAGDRVTIAGRAVTTLTGELTSVASPSPATV